MGEGVYVYMVRVCISCVHKGTYACTYMWKKLIYRKIVSSSRCYNFSVYHFLFLYIYIFFLPFSISFNIARKKYVYKRILLPTIVMNTLFCLFYIFFYLPSRGHCTRSSLYKHVFRYISAIGRDNDVFFSFSHARPYITNILILLISFHFLFFSVNYSIHRHIFIYIFSS